VLVLFRISEEEDEDGDEMKMKKKKRQLLFHIAYRADWFSLVPCCHSLPSVVAAVVVGKRELSEGNQTAAKPGKLSTRTVII